MYTDMYKKKTQSLGCTAIKCFIWTHKPRKNIFAVFEIGVKVEGT
jgi:hypothetical protein